MTACGSGLHGRTLVPRVLDREGQGGFVHDLPCKVESTLGALAPLRIGLVVGCDCIVRWRVSDQTTGAAVT